MSTRQRHSMPLFCWALALMTTAAFGGELHVPSSFATIQAAIEMAIDGDEVVVAPGTYGEALNFKGKKIVLRSSAGPALTVLDGQTLPSSILTVTSTESLETVVKGFTFINGKGTFTAACSLAGRLGGAIFVSNSGLTVADCIFENHGEANDGGDIVGGGAIFSCNSDLTVRASHFEANNAEYGGAVRFATFSGFAITPTRTATITDSTFARNKSGNGGAIQAAISRATALTVEGSRFDGNDAVHGAGLRVLADGTANVRVSDCDFTNGTAAFGGGINVIADNDVRVAISGCDFSGHEAGFGGGIFALALGKPDSGEEVQITITSCSFQRNLVHHCCDAGIYVDGCFKDGLPPQGDGKYYGGGVDVRTVTSGRITLTNCLFHENDSIVGGGAHASACGGGTIAFTNCTVIGNQADGIHVRLGLSSDPESLGGAAVRIVNSIVRGNEGAFQIPITALDPTATAHVTFSNVEGGSAGDGNIDAVSAFIDTTLCNYRLGEGAAEIDAGDNDALESEITSDLSGEPRRVDAPEVADTGRGVAPLVDMGAYEFQLRSLPGRRRPVRRPDSDCLPGARSSSGSSSPPRNFSTRPGVPLPHRLLIEIVPVTERWNEGERD